MEREIQSEACAGIALIALSNRHSTRFMKLKTARRDFLDGALNAGVVKVRVDGWEIN